MSRYYGQDVIEITAKGTAETKFVSATFQATVTKTADTGYEAKKLAEPLIDEIKKVIARFADSAKIETDRLRTSFPVEVYRKYNGHSHEFAGYKATYSIKFNAANVNEATAIHDALTSLAGIESPTPVFNMDESADVHTVAFKDAVEKGKVTFANQCKALGLDPDRYTVQSWAIGDDRPSGKTLALTNGPSAIEVEPGRAILEMTVAFAYKLKVDASSGISRRPC